MKDSNSDGLEDLVDLYWSTSKEVLCKRLTAYINEVEFKARIDAREKLLRKLTRTYNPKIMKPIEDSPMELTDEAKHYNRFVDDLNEFVRIERNKNEQRTKAKKLMGEG